MTPAFLSRTVRFAVPVFTHLTAKDAKVAKEARYHN